MLGQPQGKSRNIAFAYVYVAKSHHEYIATCTGIAPSINLQFALNAPVISKIQET